MLGTRPAGHGRGGEARRRAIRAYEQRNRRRLIDLITEAQAEGGIRADADPRLVAQAMLGAMNWVHRWFRPGGRSAEEIGEEFGRLFLVLP